MLAPRHPAPPSEVARHYDELGPLYQRLWGDHLHHGLWDESNPGASIEEATANLLRSVTKLLDLRPGQCAIDIGCGYGAPARSIAESTGADLIGLTISSHQADIARGAPAPKRGSLRIDTGDWSTNSYPDQTFDAVLSIESLSHMPDKPAFFRQLARTLKPGGQAVIACWMVAPHLSPLEALLLKSICREGRLPAIGTANDYGGFIHSAGLHLRQQHDLTSRVAPTWRAIGRRALFSPFRSLPALRTSWPTLLRRPGLALIVPRMLLAYHTGALRYGLLCIAKASSARNQLASAPPTR